jgi:hypothetical protein
MGGQTEKGSYSMKLGNRNLKLVGGGWEWKNVWGLARAEGFIFSHRFTQILHRFFLGSRVGIFPKRFYGGWRTGDGGIEGEEGGEMGIARGALRTRREEGKGVDWAGFA